MTRKSRERVVALARALRVVAAAAMGRAVQWRRRRWRLWGKWR
jgi:hypothetical protein